MGAPVGRAALGQFRKQHLPTLARGEERKRSGQFRNDETKEMKPRSKYSREPGYWQEQPDSADDRTFVLPPVRQNRPPRFRTVPARLLPFGSLFFGFIPAFLGKRSLGELLPLQVLARAWVT